MADTDMPSEPVFRANKRRKVFRKRADSDAGEEDRTAGRDVRPGEDAAGTRTAREDEEAGEGTLKLQRRPPGRKHGIGFTSSDARRSEQQPNEETALVPVSQDAEQDVQIDRFVKPTGREVVTEDKHMMAYIDSKLAERRQTAASPANIASNEGADSPSMTVEANEGVTLNHTKRPEERNYHAAQSRSDRIYERPTKRPRKKRGRERDEADVARDAYIDQLLSEAQVPIYDRSTTQTGDANGGDNDAATAEAFKAQMLEDMQNQRRRPPKAAAAKDAGVVSGPKLGGSRQQRERMRAAQEAEGKK